MHSEYFIMIVNNSELTHCNLVIKIFRSLSWTLELEITFNADSKDNLVNYEDFEYARLIDSQNSRGGYTFMLSDRLLSHLSKFESNVALLSCEKECDKNKSIEERVVCRTIFH